MALISRLKKRRLSRSARCPVGIRRCLDVCHATSQTSSDSDLLSTKALRWHRVNQPNRLVLACSRESRNTKA
ncbi:unnamed protein product [Protopolystoma xenopodis]|uniref:Uncharacterized protein n=1 Tax=Protopolystoma xenopodis TaxID=117903 RepID=A0A448XT49_9PLAT|nr:unnamed protein product [Protopolystoma xenopodis]